MGIKKINIHGWLKDVNDNFELLKGFFSGGPGWKRAPPAGLT